MVGLEGGGKEEGLHSSENIKRNIYTLAIKIVDEIIQTTT